MLTAWFACALPKQSDAKKTKYREKIRKIIIVRLSLVLRKTRSGVLDRKIYHNFFSVSSVSRFTAYSLHRNEANMSVCKHLSTRHQPFHKFTNCLLEFIVAVFNVQYKKSIVFKEYLFDLDCNHVVFTALLSDGFLVGCWICNSSFETESIFCQSFPTRKLWGIFSDDDDGKDR